MLFIKEKIKYPLLNENKNILNKNTYFYLKNNVLTIKKNQSILNNIILTKLKKQYIENNYKLKSNNKIINSYRLAYKTVKGHIII